MAEVEKEESHDAAAMDTQESEKREFEDEAVEGNERKRRRIMPFPSHCCGACSKPNCSGMDCSETHMSAAIALNIEQAA